MEKEQPIVVNLPEGQNTLTILQGDAPAQLDHQPPVRIDIKGTIFAPLNFLDKRVKDIDQHKAHILVCRDNLRITLIINEDDEYTRGKVMGELSFSDIFRKFGINADRSWVPEKLGQFLKLNRSFAANKDDIMNVISALKNFTAKVNQDMSRETNEKGDRAFRFKQTVDSNIPEKFKLKLPIFSGGEYVEIEVETYACIDGTEVHIGLQSAGANDVIEEARANVINDVIDKIREKAPEVVIIEQ